MHWFHKGKRVGMNYFNILMKEMFRLAGVPDRFTLRSLGQLKTRDKVAKKKGDSLHVNKECTSTRFSRGNFI